MKFEKLIPFIEENFITFPLWEEGIFIPCLNFWVYDDRFVGLTFGDEVQFSVEGYDFSFSKEHSFTGIVNVIITPSWEYSNDSYKLERDDYSIDEMIDLAHVGINGGIKEFILNESTRVFDNYKPYGDIFVAGDAYDACKLCKYSNQSYQTKECSWCISNNKPEEYYG